jgi:microcystin-dependent protein
MFPVGKKSSATKRWPLDIIHIQGRDQMAEPYVGEIRMFAGNFAPQGWVLCDGSTLAISLYEALYTLIGTTYGGDGQSTFMVPDLRGRAPIHIGPTATLGASGGTETVTLTSQQMAQHTHVANARTANATSSLPANNFWAGNADYLCYAAVAPDTAMNSGAIGPAGGSQPHENMMPYQAISFVMATEGNFPSSN